MTDPPDLVAPTILAAFDGWVDSGSAATTAAELLADGGTDIATFDADLLFDYRSRRPTLDIVDGRLAELTWPELTLKHRRVDEKDLLVLTGAEPDFRWREFAAAMVELVKQLGVTEWISLGAIPAAVPHTRAVPIMGTESAPGLLRADVRPGPQGTLRVPAAALSILEMRLAEAGIPALGYFAQVPHYVSGPYPVAALALLRSVERHLGIEVAAIALEEEARQSADAARPRHRRRRVHPSVRRATRIDGRRGTAAGRRRAHLRDRAVPARSGRPGRSRHPPELSPAVSPLRRPRSPAGCAWEVARARGRGTW